MTCTTRKLFDEIKALADSWPPELGEPNLQDVSWLARAVMESLAATLPEGFRTPDDGAGLVEPVEAALLAPTPTPALREVAPAEVVHRSSLLVDEIRKRDWLTKDDASNFVAALLTWRGGIGVAKTLRDLDAAGTTYTLAHRRALYSLLEAEWNQSGGNWVRYGASLARSFEFGRRRESQPEWVPPDDWVPADSPYRGIDAALACCRAYARRPVSSLGQQQTRSAVSSVSE